MSSQTSKPDLPLISVIVPVYNEADILSDTWHRLKHVLGGCEYPFEVLFINDGSSDSSEAELSRLQADHSNITIINLSRNFGKEYALTAGLDFAGGEAVITIDADLQDPPELIPDMLAEWSRGYDVVTMRRISREGESAAKRSSAWLFYRLLNRISDVPIPPDTGDFRLLSRKAVLAIRQLPERVRYMKGIFAWVGFHQKEIPYERPARVGGETKQGYFRLIRLALDGITAFSTTPLRLATYVGFITAIAAFVFGLWFIIKTLIFGDPVAGFPTLMTSMLFLGGIQLLAIGVLGEYLGRLFIESKQRPHYLVQSILRNPPDQPRKQDLPELE